MDRPYEKLLKHNLTIEEWKQWLEETPENQQEYELHYYIHYHIKCDEKNKIKFSKDLKMAEHMNFVKGWLDYKDYMLYYATEYKEVYDERDLSTNEQLDEFGFNERQKEFILHWEEKPFNYHTNDFNEFYDSLINEIIPVSFLINLYFTPIKIN